MSATDALPDAWAAPTPSKPAASSADELPPIELPTSKVLERLRYNPTDRTLVVEFRSGAVYRFFGVSQDDYTVLATSSSPGARFNTNIQPYHEFERVA